MEILPVKNAKTLKRALGQIEELWGSKPGTKKGNQLEILMTLVEVYEKKTIKFPTLKPVDIVKFHMEQNDMKQVDLMPFIGSKGLVSEVMNGKKPFSLAMVRKLKTGLGIPADLLIEEVQIDQVAV
jgi:HTH-type transcriptional regulator / antitoxin HigA